MNGRRGMGVSAGAFGACLVMGPLVQGCGMRSPTKEAAVPEAKRAVTVSPRHLVSEGGGISEAEIRYCTS